MMQPTKQQLMKAICTMSSCCVIVQLQSVIISYHWLASDYTSLVIERTGQSVSQAHVTVFVSFTDLSRIAVELG